MTEILKTLNSRTANLVSQGLVGTLHTLHSFKGFNRLYWEFQVLLVFVVIGSIGCFRCMLYFLWIEYRALTAQLSVSHALRATMVLPLFPWL